jgi:hypothetical protein
LQLPGRYRSRLPLEDVICIADHSDQLQPTSAVYARYSPDATFHDPIGLAQGLDAVKAQFNGTSMLSPVQLRLLDPG